MSRSGRDEHPRIVVVSGLPRSGTSMMMRLLRAGGLSALVDDDRTADLDNPHGYFEDQRVLDLQHDVSFVPEARGRCIKVTSHSLQYLPRDERYEVVFLLRDPTEIAVSQARMMARREGSELPEAFRPPTEEVALLQTHRESTRHWLRTAPGYRLRLLEVEYGHAVERPLETAARVRGFLGRDLDVARMASAVDPELYRNRRGMVARHD